MPRKYTPSPETQQAEREARVAGFIRAAEACEVLGIREQHLAAFAASNGIKPRKVGRKIWYQCSGMGIGAHLLILEKLASARYRLAIAYALPEDNQYRKQLIEEGKKYLHKAMEDSRR